MIGRFNEELHEMGEVEEAKPMVTISLPADLAMFVLKIMEAMKALPMGKLDSDPTTYGRRADTPFESGLPGDSSGGMHVG